MSLDLLQAEMDKMASAVAAVESKLKEVNTPVDGHGRLTYLPSAGGQAKYMGKDLTPTKAAVITEAQELAKPASQLREELYALACAGDDMAMDKVGKPRLIGWRP